MRCAIKSTCPGCLHNKSANPTRNDFLCAIQHRTALFQMTLDWNARDVCVCVCVLFCSREYKRAHTFDSNFIRAQRTQSLSTINKLRANRTSPTHSPRSPILTPLAAKYIVKYMPKCVRVYVCHTGMWCVRNALYIEQLRTHTHTHTPRPDAHAHSVWIWSECACSCVAHK